MPLPLLAIAAGATILANGAKAIKGGMDAAAGRRLQESLVRPEYNIEQEYYNNQSIAQNVAQTGLTQESKDFYSRQATDGLTYGVDASLRGGGGANMIANLYNTYNQDNQRVMAEDSQLRISNIKSLMDQNSALAGQKTYQWAINEYEPYKDNAKAAALAISSGNQSMWNGISGVTGAMASYAQAKTYEKALQDGSGSGGAIAPPINPANFGTNPVQTPPASNGDASAEVGLDPAMLNFLQNTLKSRTYKSQLS